MAHNKATGPSIPSLDTTCAECPRDERLVPGLILRDNRTGDAIHLCGLCLKRTPALSVARLAAWARGRSSVVVP